jgi:hypothetical protein
MANADNIFLDCGCECQQRNLLSCNLFAANRKGQLPLAELHLPVAGEGFVW